MILRNKNKKYLPNHLRMKTKKKILSKEDLDCYQKVWRKPKRNLKNLCSLLQPGPTKIKNELLIKHADRRYNVAQMLVGEVATKVGTKIANHNIMKMMAKKKILSGLTLILKKIRQHSLDEKFQEKPFFENSLKFKKSDMG